MPFRRAMLAALFVSAAACNSVLDIEEAKTISQDSDLSDGQDERGGFVIGEAPASETPATTKAAVATETCEAGEKSCGGKCVSMDDPRFGCGGDTCAGCRFARTTRTQCIEQACAVLDCQPGFDDCDGDPSNGCETDLTLPQSCGACRNACGSKERFCVAKTCSSEPAEES